MMLIHQTSQLDKNTWKSVAFDFGLPYLSISVSLNILLTLMIIIRLVVYSRNIRTAMGVTGTSGLCKAIATMFIESCALYAVSLVLVPGLPGSGIVDAFLPVLAHTQVRGTFL